MLCNKCYFPSEWGEDVITLAKTKEVKVNELHRMAKYQIKENRVAFRILDHRHSTSWDQN